MGSNSKINFEVLYLTQFSVFMKKNKKIRCILFITEYNIATIAISIFQFQKEIVNNLVFWIILYFLLTIFFLYVVQF